MTKLRPTIEEGELERLLQLGRTRNALAEHYSVSKSTIGRRIKKWNLLGIAKKGRPRTSKPKRRPSPVRMYRATITSTWYDKEGECAREYEIHMKVARRGSIRRNREYLAQRGIPYFQQLVYRRYRRWIPKWQVKTRFEREEPALHSKSTIHIEVRMMEYRGKRWTATSLPSRVLSYVKTSRTRA